MMSIMLIGLLIFLGIHSARAVSEDWRQRQIERMGVTGWRTLHSVLSLAGLVLIIYGYGQARLDPVLLWTPPLLMRQLALVLTALAFVLLAAAFVPGNALREKPGQPALLGIIAWSLAHLLVNGMLADLLLFGTLLVWAAIVFFLYRRRDRAAGIAAGPARPGATILTVAIGLLFWAMFAFYLHSWLIGQSDAWYFMSRLDHPGVPGLFVGL